MSWAYIGSPTGDAGDILFTALTKADTIGGVTIILNALRHIRVNYPSVSLALDNNNLI